MKKLLIGLLFSIFCSVPVRAITYQSVRASTATAVAPTLQTGAMNLSSGTIQNLNTSTLTVTSALSVNSISVSTISVTSAATISSLTVTGNTVLSTVTASSATFSQVTISTLTINTAATISSATITNLISSTGTFTNMSISSMTSTLPMSGRKITGLSSGTVSTDAATFGQARLIQTQFFSGTTGTTTTSNTFGVTVTTGNITPSSTSNKVLVVATGHICIGANNREAEATIIRSGSNIGGTHGFAYIVGNTGTTITTLCSPATIVYLDSPASSTNLGYAVGLRSVDNATSAMWNNANSTTWTMTLAEIQPN